MAEAQGQRYSLTIDTSINASPGKAWKLLVDPTRVGDLFWGSTVESDFRPGSPIVWKGTWEGKPFEDRGTIVAAEKDALLRYTHWSPSSGPDVEANRNLLTWRLAPEGAGVRVSFSHENIATEAMRDHSRGMWNQMLARMKEMLEKDAQAGSDRR